MNKTIDVGNGVSAVIMRKSQHKEILTAGDDFFYVDTESISKMSSVEKDWVIVKRTSINNYSVSSRDKNRREIRLNRLLTGVLGDPSIIVVFANRLFYDFRMKNLLLGGRGDSDMIAEKRAIVLPKLTELPKQIKNDLAEENGRSVPQESLIANSLNIHRAVTLELKITDQIKLQCHAHNSEEEKIISEAMKILQERATIVSR